jgi:hypothetical protein
MKTPITFMCVQPCIPYYAWQIEVMLTNFRDAGITSEFQVQCLFAFNKNESDWEEKVAVIKKVEESMKNVASFFYYEDTRVYPISYISSIRPNILKQHFKKYPNFSQECIFYHDCDIIFTKFPDFLYNLNENDNNWYVSDTIGYIGHNYIQSKGEEVLDAMCDIVGINKNLVKERESQSGGAQYLLKGVDWVFFDKMEKDCESLFKNITELNIKIAREHSLTNPSKPAYHELQIWCADMWAILWQGWMRGYNTKVIPELGFCWATDTSQKWHDMYIFHNAGVTSSSADRLFYKGNFTNKLPYYETGDNYDKNTASYKYFQIIKSIGKNSCLHIEQPEEHTEKPKSNILDKLSEIFESYMIAINPSDEQKDVAAKRLETCMSCEYWETSATGAKVCSKCGCYTKGKIFSPKGSEACPMGKWTI